MKTLAKQLNKDNRGVSILEVVIAVAILVALSIPVLRGITTSAKYQYRSRIRQAVTTEAESLMEVYKAYSKEELEEKNLEKTSITVDGIDFNVEVKINPRISFDEVTFMEDFDKVSCAYGFVNINRVAAESFMRDDFSKYADGFLELLQEKEQFYKGEKALTVADIDYSKLVLLQRILVVNISNNRASYEVKCVYSIKNHPYYKDDKGTEIGYFDSPEYESIIEGNKEFFTGSTLNRVYIFYYPIYDTGAYPFDDIIEVNNSGDEKISLFLIKQFDEDTGAAVSIYEQSYYPLISLEGNSLKLYHNFDTNISGSNSNDLWKREIRGFSNDGFGEPLQNAITQLKDDENENIYLYDISIRITKDGEEWAILSSTVKK